LQERKEYYAATFTTYLQLISSPCLSSQFLIDQIFYFYEFFYFSCKLVLLNHSNDKFEYRITNDYLLEKYIQHALVCITRKTKIIAVNYYNFVVTF
jgi:uncharacterized membrane protein